MLSKKQKIIFNLPEWVLWFILFYFVLVSTSFVLFFSHPEQLPLAITLFYLPFLFLTLLHPILSVITAFIFALVSSYLAKINVFPYGIFVDISLLVGVVAAVGNILVSKTPSKVIWGTHTDYAVLIWITYCLIQALNPELVDIKTWLYSNRTMSLFLVFYFVGKLSFPRNPTFSKAILWGLSFLSLGVAMYGLWQFYFGFSSIEYTWLAQYPERLELYSYEGILRPFSLLSDPTTFGIYTGASIFVSLYLFVTSSKTRYKVILGSILLLSLWAMYLSGSRTALMMIPISVGIYLLFNMNALSYLLGVGGILLVFLFINFPSENLWIKRGQSVFQLGSNNASISIRNENRIFIQPQVKAYPFGQGLGSTGYWGNRFVPEGKLSNFIHDSGLLRIAVELGWVGLFLFLTCMFIFISESIRGYIYSKSKRDKIVFMLIILMFTSLTLAHFTQESIIQMPINILFVGGLIVLDRLLWSIQK